jgi:hypothetical protein
MATFRRWFTALAVLALVAGLASAQVGIGGGGPGGPFACSANGAGSPQLREEGFTELLSDILISCTGGPAYPSGTQIPTTHITVYITNGYAITSRLFSGSGGLSEVLLLIDEPGSGLTTGVVGPYGPNAPQTLCTNIAGCPAYVGTDPGTVGGPYEVAVSAPGGTTPAANVYQGYLGVVGSNTVTFFGVPVLPPVVSGVSRVFRIVNIRYPVTAISHGSPVSAAISASPSQVLPVSPASFPVGNVYGPGMVASVNPAPAGGKGPFSQCASPTAPQLSAQVRFQGSFIGAFKTRVVPLTNTAWATTVPNTGSPGQNIPGGLYLGFAGNTESGFILPSDTATIGSVTYTAGLTDYGTRLKAVFTNIPAGVTLYVSTSNAGGYAVPGGTSTASYAALVSANPSNDAIYDGAALTPLTSALTGSDGLTAYALAPTGGVAAAIWEVVNTNHLAADTLTFSVYISYASGAPVPVSSGMPVPNVALSYAPEPGGGSFSAAQGPTALTSPLPRFVVFAPQQGSWVSITLCSVVPAISPVGLSALGLLLAIVGAWTLARRRAAHHPSP